MGVLNFMKLGLLWMIVLGTICSYVETAYPLKILGIFPHPGMSHFMVFNPVLRGLAEAGHEVTVISFFPDKNPPPKYKDLPLEGMALLKDTIDLKLLEGVSQIDRWREFYLLHNWGKDSCNVTLNSPALKQVLKKKNYYDIVITEQFCSDCTAAIAHVLNAPLVGMSSCALMPWHYQRFGAPYNPGFIPNSWTPFSEEMTFTQRLINWFTFHVLTLMHKHIDVPVTDALVRSKFGENIPSVGELVKNTSLMLVNQHYSLAGVKPLPPTIIEIGGIHIQKVKPLPEELKNFIENAEHGVIVISWGHMIIANTLRESKRDGLLKAIRRLKQRVIWKWDNDTIENKPDNLLITHWLPQLDVLCHPNVKVFMAHGGLLGSSEAAHCGVPVVVTPQYGDQFTNAESMVYRGMAVKLPFKDLNESTVLSAIRKALEKRYQDNAQLVSYDFTHRPKTPLQTAIWWIEHVARTKGARLLKSKSSYLSSFIYDSLDIHLFLLGISILLVATWIWLLGKISGNKKQVNDKSKKE